MGFYFQSHVFITKVAQEIKLFFFFKNSFIVPTAQVGPPNLWLTTHRRKIMFFKTKTHTWGEGDAHKTTTFVSHTHTQRWRGTGRRGDNGRWAGAWAGCGRITACSMYNQWYFQLCEAPAHTGHNNCFVNFDFWGELFCFKEINIFYKLSVFGKKYAFGLNFELFEYMYEWASGF